MKNRINNRIVKDFLSYSIPAFINEIDIHASKTCREDKYHIIEYGELGLVNFYINGIVRNDPKHRYLIKNEFELRDKNENYAGRVDIIIEDCIENVIYFIEAKRIYSNENEPETEYWSENATKKYYNKVLFQARKYFDADMRNLSKFKSAFRIALIFSSIEFSDESKITIWDKYIPMGNEFYIFKKYRSLNSSNWLGLACYGTTETC